MKEDKEDFGGLTPVNTPLDWLETRRMQMAFFIVPARLKKLKRLVDNLYRNNWVIPMGVRRLLRLIKIKKLFGYGLE